MLLRFWTLLSLLVSGAACLPAAILYNVTDLGTLDLSTIGGSSTYGTAINNAGQITGFSGSHAFLYSNGVMTDLATLLYGSVSVGYGINNAGQITGSYANHTFLYSNGVMTDLGILGGTYSSVGYGINNAGQITGSYSNGNGDQHAFLYSNGVVTNLGTLQSGAVQDTVWDMGSITPDKSREKLALRVAFCMPSFSSTA